MPTRTWAWHAGKVRAAPKNPAACAGGYLVAAGLGGDSGMRFALMLRGAPAVEFPKGGSGHDPHAEE